MTGSGLSAGDLALLRDNDGMFGGNGVWAIVLFFLLAWGGNGFGFGNRGGMSYDVPATKDFVSNEFNNQSVINKLNGLENGLCDGFYAVNTSLLDGFAGVNNSIMTNGYETRNAINNVSSQLAECCCKTQSAIQGVNYNLATNTCALQNTMNMNTRDIVDTVNANYRALHDEIVANRIEDKNAQIQAQQNEINSLRLAASQSAQNAYLLSELKPCPSPSYIVPNPNCCYNYQVKSGWGNY